MKYYKMSAGIGQGKQRITAFDKALIEAEVGNYNLVRLSSILPLDAKEKQKIELPLGSLLPIAYAVESTDIIGERIASAVAIGFPLLQDESRCGVIMEYEGKCSAEEARDIVKQMVKEGFEARDWTLHHIESCAVETICEKGYATTFACVAEWEE